MRVIELTSSKVGNVDLLVREIYDKEPILELVLQELKKDKTLAPAAKKTLIKAAQKHDSLLRLAKKKAKEIIDCQCESLVENCESKYKRLITKYRKELETLKKELDRLERLCKNKIILLKADYIRPYYKAKEDLGVLLDTELPQLLLTLVLGG